MLINDESMIYLFFVEFIYSFFSYFGLTRLNLMRLAALKIGFDSSPLQLISLMLEDFGIRYLKSMLFSKLSSFKVTKDLRYSC